MEDVLVGERWRIEWPLVFASACGVQFDVALCFRTLGPYCTNYVPVIYGLM